MKKSTVVLIAGATAAAAGAAGYLLFRRRLQRETDCDDAFSDLTPAVTKVSDATGEEKARKKGIVTAGMKEPTLVTGETVENQLLAEALREIGVDGPSNKTAKTAPGASGSVEKGAPGSLRREFPLLGLSLSVPPPWDVREDLSPFPNVAMLSFWNHELVKEDEPPQPGVVPMILLSVEDVRGDNLTLGEFKDRCKELAVNQMMMMSGGAIEPRVTKDESIRIGPFRHALEYTQSLPPVCNIVVLNLIEVRDSVAYTFQIMGSVEVMEKYKSLFMKFAESLRIAEGASTALGYVELRTGVVKVDIDTTWTWSYPGSNGALAEFKTSAASKKEMISLYAQNDVPVSGHKIREEKTVDGVVISTAYEGEQQQKTFSYNGYALVVKPLQKAVSCINERDLVGVLKSVSPSTADPKPKKGGTFVNHEHGYRMDIVGGGRLVASRIGGGSVAYAPLGLNEDAGGDQPPTVTVRVGTPENDPECMATIEEWETRMREEAAENGLKKITRTTINGEPCLSFMTQSMEEVMPGQRMEVCGKVFIFVREGVTTLVRWEMATGLWRKFEKDVEVFIESLEFI
ncbi:hypothetical protein ERJ75_001667900 [Trypanosoma vivax]|nr:putative dynamin-like protein [Trypanosoma vivax]KAH8605069.1 hypothetical protein ERJ75_001667900 [Trypanosoma vivax]